VIPISKRNEYPVYFSGILITIKCRPISEMATNRLLHHNADTSRKEGWVMGDNAAQGDT
jgi:hypothetical protein